MADLLDDPEILRTMLDSLQTGVCLTDREHKIRFWNEGAERITGYHVTNSSDIRGKNVLPHCPQSCSSSEEPGWESGPA